MQFFFVPSLKKLTKLKFEVLIQQNFKLFLQELIYGYTVLNIVSLNKGIFQCRLWSMSLISMRNWGLDFSYITSHNNLSVLEDSKIMSL